MSDNDIFVISQVGEKGSAERKRADEVYEFVIRPVAKERNLNVRRSDLDSTPGQVTTQIVQAIINSTVIVADLTGRNPNVYYELGVAQAFGKPTILLIKDTSALPFDVRNERMITIGDDASLTAVQADDAKQSLRKALDVVLSDGFKVSNLVTEAASARSLEALAPDNPVASEMAAMRTMLGDILHQVSSRAPANSTTSASEMEKLKAHLMYLAKTGQILASNIKLIDESTSLEFDEWVSDLMEAARVGWNERVTTEARAKTSGVPAPSYDYGDEPF